MPDNPLMPSVRRVRGGWLAAVAGAVLLPLDPLLGLVLMSLGLHRSRRRR
jgi:hypothetical protein